MSGFEIIEGGGYEYELIDEIPGSMKAEKFTGTINGHLVEVGRMNRYGYVDYSIHVDGRSIASAVSQSEAKAALKSALA